MWRRSASTGSRAGWSEEGARQVQFDASDIVGKLVYYTLLLLCCSWRSVSSVQPDQRTITAVIAFLPKLIVAIIIVVVAAAIAAGVKTLVGAPWVGCLRQGPGHIGSIFILFLGVVAALEQVGIGDRGDTPLLIAILATVAGVIIVGAGGGLIRPMQMRWESYLSRAEEEAPKIKAQARNAPSPMDQARSAPTG